MNNDDMKKVSLVFIAILALSALLYGGYYLIFIFHQTGTLLIQTDYPGAVYSVDTKTTKFNSKLDNGTYLLSATVPVGKHNLIMADKAGTVQYAETFKINKGKETTVRIVVPNPDSQNTLLEGE